MRNYISDRLGNNYLQAINSGQDPNLFLEQPHLEPLLRLDTTFRSQRVGRRQLGQALAIKKFSEEDSHSSYPLALLLTWFRDCQASDDRDKVFALL
jgi:hypothetical protein